jgi:hypothetical protein
MKMKKILLTIFVTMLLLSFSHCDGDSSGSKSSSSGDIENLPNDYNVSLPDSVSSDEARSTTPQSSVGTKALQKARKDMEQENAYVAGLFVLADKTISENGGVDKFTDGYTNGPKFEITQKLYDTMLEVGNGKVQEGFEVGKEFAFPQFQYVGKDKFEATIPEENKKLKEQLVKLEELYDYLFIAAAEGEPKEDGSVEKKDKKSRLVYIFWDLNKTNTRVVSYEKQKLDLINDEQHRVLDIIFEEREDGLFSTVTRAEDFPPYIWENNKWVLKTTQEGEALGVGRDVDLMILTLHEKDPDNKGVVIDLYRKKRRLMNEDVTKGDSMENSEQKLYGYADNNGGFVETFSTMAKERKADGTKVQGFSSDIDEKRHEELFKSDGSLFAARFINNQSGEWEDNTGYTWPLSNDDEFGHKAKFKQYKDEFFTNKEKFDGEKGADGAQDNYKADNEFIFDVKLPDISTHFSDKKKAQFVIVKDEQTVSWTQESDWNFVVGFASIDKKKYDEMKSGGDIILRFNVKLKKDAGYVDDFKNLPVKFDLYLVTKKSQNGSIEAATKINIIKVENSTPLLYKPE